MVAQIRSGYWSGDRDFWTPRYRNLTDVKIDSYNFSAHQVLGEFVIYDGAERVKGLKIDTPWSNMPDAGQWEIGIRNNAMESYFSGRFTAASLRELDPSELRKMTEFDLMIMRNEIFARYGLKFKPGGQMDVYFRKQSWYQPSYDSVDSFLTTLERYNIGVIKKFERLDKNEGE